MITIVRCPIHGIAYDEELEGCPECVKEPAMADRWQARPDRPTVVPMRHVRIEEQLDRLKREPAWQSGSRNAITLTKEPSLQVVLTVLRKGTKLHEHRVSGLLTLHVLAGAMMFRTREGALRVRPGEIVVLESALEHEVEALEESAFLLTLVQPSEREDRRGIARGESAGCLDRRDPARR